MNYIGIDPGASGGIAVVDDDGLMCGACKMPEGDRDVIDTLRLYAGARALASMEKVSASRQMGVTSSFKFGQGYGAIRMALVSADIAFDYVMPKRWQSALGCRLVGGKGFGERDSTAAKNLTKRRAQELFPMLPNGVKITHATADAMLLAEYCRRYHKGLLVTTSGGD